MVTETDLERQVAEAKCPCAQPSPGFYPGVTQCETCHGTGLRWPNLSRECLIACGHPRGWKRKDCDLCHGSGRIADCTEGKLLDIYLRAHGDIHLVWDEQVGVFSIDPGDQILNFVGKTVKDTLAAALLATVTP